MCGIAGWIGSPIADPSIAERIIGIMHHRGPDDQAVRVWPEATLIHTRLSIIDLSPSGTQPMANEDGTVYAVFNGEIYNHKEIRTDLIGKGHTFRGRADTEVITHLYEEHGLDLAAHLRGMFALAVWDARETRLILTRDRFGIKPLFYSTSGDRLAFASEIRALLAIPDVDRRPDRQAVHDFAALFYVPAPLTLYRGIRALLPGETLEARVEGDRVVWGARRHHRWVIRPTPELTYSGAVEKAAELTDAAVGKQLESDVELGTLLSGGIDSSLITQAAQRSTPGGVSSFNVEFPESDYDETWAALAVSRHLGNHHTTLTMDAMSGSWDEVTSVLAQAGQPYADTSLFAASAICRLMREHIKVALSGDGGDEVFGGYGSFRYIESITSLQRLPGSLLQAVSRTLPWVAKSRLLPERYCQRFVDLSTADDVGIMENILSWVRPRELAGLCRDRDLLPVRRWFEPEWEYALPAKSSRTERLSALNTEIHMRLVLPNDYLFKVDTASMRSSLEVRVPMLDENLVEFGLTLPHHLKVHGNNCKWVLRGVARRRLPLRVARKPKQGFMIPVDTWVDASFRTRVQECLLSPDSRLREFFQASGYRPLVEAFCNSQVLPGISRAGLFGRVVMLLSLELSLTATQQ